MTKADLLSEKESLLTEKLALEANISSFAERQADHRAHAEEMEKLLTELKKVKCTVSDLEIEQSDLLKQLNVEKMAVAANEEKITVLESSKEVLLRQLFNIKTDYKEQLRSMEGEIGSLHDEGQRLYQVNAKIHEQVASIGLERDDALVEKDRVKANIIELEVIMLELGSAKKALQQTLEEERASAQNTISSLQQESKRLQQSEDQLIDELSSVRSKAEAEAEYNKQLAMSLASVQFEKAQLELLVSSLREDLVLVGNQLEFDRTLQEKQKTDLEQLQNENSKLTSENSDMLKTISMPEDQCKLLMVENEKKAEQIAFLSGLSADLEVSHSALQGEMSKQKAACEALESNNAVLQSSIETKAKAILVLERQIDDFEKKSTALESQIETISSTNSMLELQVKNLQVESIAQIAALDAEKQEKLHLHSTLEDRNSKIQSLEGQLAEAAKHVALVETQLETSNKKHQDELEYTLSAVYKDLAKAEAVAATLEKQAKADLDCLLSEKKSEIGNLKAQVDEALHKNSDLTNKLKECNDEKSMLGAWLKSMEAELSSAKGKVVKAEKQLVLAANREGEFNKAFKRVSLLEAQLSAKATMQNQLEFQVISLQNDLQAARASSAKVEKGWKANMESMRESANARSRTLEEQLESVKKTLDEMLNSANKGQESIACFQTQLACLTEEKSSLEKKVFLHPRSLEAHEPHQEEEPVEGKAAQRRLNEKAKLVRLALPVFLISAASSVVIAGIQSYMKSLEN
ncbi:hypothetical protein L7F22_005025 [Adiantum nelumboides]|nr:hypothetical protein [Adiantum nelumboides]